MFNHSPLSLPPSDYDGFLFEVIGKNSNGTPLSVLSVLARANVDPWKEAARLSALPKTIAEKALASMLGGISEKDWNPIQEAEIARRLAQLLPRQNNGARLTPNKAAEVGMQLPNFWLVWLSFALVITMLSPHRHQATATSTSSSVSNPGPTVPSRNGNAHTASVNTNSHFSQPIEHSK